MSEVLSLRRRWGLRFDGQYADVLDGAPATGQVERVGVCGGPCAETQVIVIPLRVAVRLNLNAQALCVQELAQLVRNARVPAVRIDGAGENDITGDVVPEAQLLHVCPQ